MLPRNSQFLDFFANSIMWKATALIIFNLVEEWVYHKALSTMGRDKLSSAPGSVLIKTTLVKSQAKEL